MPLSLYKAKPHLSSSSLSPSTLPRMSAPMAASRPSNRSRKLDAPIGRGSSNPAKCTTPRLGPRPNLPGHHHSWPHLLNRDQDSFHSCLNAMTELCRNGLYCAGCLCQNGKRAKQTSMQSICMDMMSIRNTGLSQHCMACPAGLQSQWMLEYCRQTCLASSYSNVSAHGWVHDQGYGRQGHLYREGLGRGALYDRAAVVTMAPVSQLLGLVWSKAQVLLQLLTVPRLMTSPENHKLSRACLHVWPEGTVHS